MTLLKVLSCGRDLLLMKYRSECRVKEDWLLDFSAQFISASDKETVRRESLVI